MLIFDTTWQRINGRFTEEEKQKLRDVYLGESVCPPGMVIDEMKLDADLRAKLMMAKKERLHG